jgi:large subunit ribosomal protein L13
MKQSTIKPNEIERKWYLVDAQEVILGRAASKIAQILSGKHRPYYSPQWDMGDYVVVINAEKIMVTGKKEQSKKYYRHTGYPGGLKEQNLGEVREKYPERLLEKAVRGMLPQNRLQEEILTKLYIYSGSEHPHAGQQPEKLDI